MVLGVPQLWWTFSSPSSTTPLSPPPLQPSQRRYSLLPHPLPSSSRPFAGLQTYIPRWSPSQGGSEAEKKDPGNYRIFQESLSQTLASTLQTTPLIRD